MLEKLKDSRRQQVTSFRKAGLTYAEIGRRLGITRERVRRIDKEIRASKKPKMESALMLTTGEVALMLGVHPTTVRRWSNQGILKAYYIGPRHDRRFNRRDIEMYLVNQSVTV